MLTFVQSVARAVHNACRVRTPTRWLGLIALVAALTGLAAQAEPVTISPEGARASAALAARLFLLRRSSGPGVQASWLQTSE